MRVVHWIVSKTIKGCTRILCRIDGAALKKIPAKGPLILACNHINFLEAPVIYTHLLPRPITGLAKSESWDNFWLGKLFDIWNVIPLQRGEADLKAMNLGLDALKQGKIVAITPEGTRSGNGRLLKAHPGVVTLAVRSHAPILPIVYWGHEIFKTNFKHLRRTDFHIRVGEPFIIDDQSEKVTHHNRQAIADEIMSQVAVLLPPEYRGVYASDNPQPARYLRFLNPLEEFVI